MSMAEVCRKMVSSEGSSANCREARRRRMELRKLAGVAVVPGSESPSRDSLSCKEKRQDNSNHSDKRKRNRTSEISDCPSLSSSSPSSESREAGTSSTMRSTSVQILLDDTVPAFGSISVSGRSREMEDCLYVRVNLCRPEITCGRPLHFFAVYDGHGGSHERMHVFLEEELMREESESGEDGRTAQQERWRSAMGRCFERMDEVALNACACGKVVTPCECERAGLTSEIVGSTALVGVITPDSIIVANCGDSRAVLSRGGKAIPLSFDHKPDRPDELSRIEAAGGRVIYLNGARVLGILAMSRALGDKYLKPIVISEPELTITERTPEDECLILASDGLWDVLSNDMACDVARRCLQEAEPSNGTRILNSEPQLEGNDGEHQCQSRCSLAAALLTRLALGRKSADNISVIVIDLKRA
ncbi:PREDICTED: probable protein phosphatase 2C 75 isoform X2 [Nelumbo nucifera]|uniref:protein-serine/threonine phosphatase n=1 Tax=Nelumbo nucifera TaxID=4432 RepID=A0A1U7Z9U9_NELNU|nr:PREDICTED: probable protein phosphatase 2C 75 isoform X2 [Nelumbo nucifera]